MVPIRLARLARLASALPTVHIPGTVCTDLMDSKCLADLDGLANRTGHDESGGDNWLLDLPRRRILFARPFAATTNSHDCLAIHSLLAASAAPQASLTLTLTLR